MVFVSRVGTSTFFKMPKASYKAVGRLAESLSSWTSSLNPERTEEGGLVDVSYIERTSISLVISPHREMLASSAAFITHSAISSNVG